MVAGRLGTAGKSRLGCLFSLLVFVAATYFGISVFEVYLRFYKIQDEVKQQGHFAPALTDDVIRRRLVARSDSLGLPLGLKAWDVRRSNDPREITIRAEYDDSVVIELPGFTKVFRFHFTPSTRVPL